MFGGADILIQNLTFYIEIITTQENCIQECDATLFNILIDNIVIGKTIV